MERYLCILTQKGCGNKEYIEEYFNSKNLTIIFDEEASNLDEKNKESFLHNLSNEYSKKFVKRIKKNIDTLSEILIIHQGDNMSFNDDIDIEICDFGVVSDNADCFILSDGAKSEFYAGILFWKTIFTADKFQTRNDKLFESLYLPVQLSKDGSGIFFEERIENRLKEIGFISETEVLETIIDRGGWESLNSLTAKIDVVSIKDDKKRKTSLLSTALVPAPPIRPEVLTDIYDKRRLVLNLLGINTSALLASGGLLYEKEIPFSVKKYISNPKSVNLKSVLKDTIRIAAILDFGMINLAKTDIAAEEYGKIADIIEISNINDLEFENGINLVHVLKTDGKVVYWTELSKDLRKFGSYDEKYHFRTVEKILPKKERQFARNYYQEMINTFSNEKSSYH